MIKHERSQCKKTKRIRLQNNADNTDMRFRTLRGILKARNVTVQGVQITIGAALISAAVMFFLLPNQISTGGFSGIATIFYYFLDMPVGISVMVLNIPLFLVVLIKGGKKYFFNAIFGTAILSVFLNIFGGFNPLTRG